MKLIKYSLTTENVRSMINLEAPTLKALVAHSPDLRDLTSPVSRMATRILILEILMTSLVISSAVVWVAEGKFAVVGIFLQKCKFLFLMLFSAQIEKF